MRIARSFFFFLLYSTFANLIDRVEITDNDRFGGLTIVVHGVFTGISDTIIQLYGDDVINCNTKAVDSEKIVCDAVLNDGTYDVELSYLDADATGHTELCDTSACAIFVLKSDEPDPDVPRPVSRIKDGRRNPNYGRGANVPVIYSISPSRGSVMGGSLITIEGRNLGDVLSSFGEEGRQGTSSILVYFERDGIQSKCNLITHYHNPTQIFCVLDPLSIEQYFELFVFINGDRVQTTCGSCFFQSHRNYDDRIEKLFSGNLVSPSGEPQWTNWTTGTASNQIWGEVYQQHSTINNQYHCTAPLDVQMRYVENLELVDERDVTHVGSDNVTCNEEEGQECSELQFRYLCDDSSIKIQMNGKGHEGSFSYHNVNELSDNHIMGINVETISSTPTTVAICTPSYEDEGGEIHQMEIYSFHSTWYGMVNCRIDSDQVGHFHLNVRTMRDGRSRMSQMYTYFTNEGQVATFTLAPAIHSISPSEGSVEGGTFLTITGRSLSTDYHTSAVLVGGEICEIITATATKIVCQTHKPAAVQEIYAGGAGATQHMFKYEQTGSWKPSFRSLDITNTKFSRILTTAYHEYGWYRFGYNEDHFWSLLKGTLIPPVTGYYSFISNKDDNGDLWMSTDGSNVRENMEMITYGCYGIDPDCSTGTSKKIYMDASNTYAFEHYYHEYGGSEYGNVGLIYHGSDPIENVNHSPLRDSYETSGAAHYQYEYNPNKLRFLDEKQYIRVKSTKITERHIMKVYTRTGPIENVKFQLRWGNSIGQFRDTTKGTFNEHVASDGQRVRDLVQSQCRTIGSIQAVAYTSWELTGNYWPYAKTVDEVHCGQSAGRYNYRWIYHHNYHCEQQGVAGLSRYYSSLIDDVPQFCFAYFNVASNAELQLKVGYMRKGASTTFGGVMDNIAYTNFYFNVFDILTLPDAGEWNHECINIRTLVRDHIAVRDDQHPNFVNDIYIHSVYAKRDWGYIDDIALGVASGDYKVEQTVTPHRPNTRVGDIVVRMNSDTQAEFEYLDTSCNVDIAEMSVIGDSVTTEDVVKEVDGNDVQGKRYIVTEGDNSIAIEIWKSTLVSPGLVGTFSLGYKEMNTSEIDISTASPISLESLLRPLHGDLSTIKVDTFEGNCQDGYSMRFKWNKGGDYPLLQFNDLSITGVDKLITTEETRSGGVYVKSLPGTYMAQTFDRPQVQVKREGILATCNKVNCGFDFTAAASINSASPSVFTSLESSGNSISFSGEGLSNIEKMTFDDYECSPSNSDCTITSISDNEFLLTFTSLPHGLVSITAHTTHGKATVVSPLVSVKTTDISISVGSGTRYGGTLVTLSGQGLGLGTQGIKFGIKDAEIESRTTDNIVLRTPENEIGTVSITMSNGVTLTNYEYVDTDFATITLDDTEYSVKGEEVTVTFSKAIISDIVLFFDDVIIGTATISGATKHILTMPVHAPGDVNFRVRIGDIGYTNNIKVKYVLSVDGVSPIASSTDGGTILTITGKGFGFKASSVDVLVGDVPCTITECKNGRILCRTNEYYKNHEIVMSGSNWFPKEVTVNQNDRITWKWATYVSVNVEIESVDAIDGTVGNGVFKIPKQSGTIGTTSRIMSESVGTYYYTSGPLDNSFATYLNGVITVNTAVDFELEVKVFVDGFRAIKDQVRKWRKQKKEVRVQSCTVMESDITGKDPSILLTANCTDCLTHTYSFQRTPVASAAAMVDHQITISAPSILDHEGCTEMFDVSASPADYPDASVVYTVVSVIGDTLVANMSFETENWPIGENLKLHVSQKNRGNIQVDANLATLNVQVEPTLNFITPTKGSGLGSGILTLSGVGFYYEKYGVTDMAISMCSEVLTVTPTEVTCRLIPPTYLGGIEASDVMSNLAVAYSGTNIIVTVDIELESTPETYSSSAYPSNLLGLPSQEENTVSVETTIEDVSNDGKIIYRFVMTIVETKVDDYALQLYISNFGLISVGDYGRGVTILSSDVTTGGSFGGGHLITFDTSYHGGMLPSLLEIEFEFDGMKKLCPDYLQTSVNANTFCHLEPLGDSRMTVRTPNAFGITGGDVATIRFLKPEGLELVEDTRMRCETAEHCQYTYDIMKTTVLTAISDSTNPNDNSEYIAGEELILQLDRFEPQNAPCSDIKVYIGMKECTVNTCDSTNSLVSCTIPGQPKGTYPIRVHFHNVGDAVSDVDLTMAYHIQHISPLIGSYGGGTEITVTGSGFLDNDNMGTLCDEALESCIVNSDNTQAVCLTPSMKRIAAEDHLCEFYFYQSASVQRGTINFNFQNTSTAVVTSVQPKRGGTEGGTRITILGSKFVAGETTVSIDGSVCTIIFETTALIVCETSAHREATGKHAVLVFITDNGNAIYTDEDDATFWYVDRWSSIFTWGCNDTNIECPGKPVDMDIAVIPWGKTVLLDESTPLLSVLLIQGGTLIWDHADGIKLRAQYVLITDEGHFEVGTPEEPFCGTADEPITADIELFGHHRSIRLPIYGSKVFAVRNGTVDIHGCPIDVTWTVISETAEAGATEIKLKQPVRDSNHPMRAWKAGDDIVIATTGGRLTMKQNEEKKVAWVSEDGLTIGLDSPLMHRHIYHWSTWDGKELEVAAEVGLLTRNIKFHGNVNDEWTTNLTECDEEYDPEEGAIQSCYENKWGDEVGSDQFGAHFILHYIQRARISHMEVFHAGQGFQLGRYPLHFHNSGNQPDSYISYNGIHHTFNRAVTTHGVWNATVEWNVAFNCMGHNFFIEDAVEEDLIIQYNLAIKTKPSNSLLNSDQKATAFWITNTYNTIQHNHAAGGVQMGFWVNPPEESGHANADCPPLVQSHCPVFTGVKKWYNNTAHDMGLYGFWVMTLIEGSSYRPSTTDCAPSWPPGEAIFERGIFWNCLRGAEFALVGDNIWMKDFIVANNELGGLSVKESSSYRYEGEYGEYSMGIKDSTVIGYIDKTVPELSRCTRFGVETPWKPGGSMSIEGIKFFNFDSPEGAIDHCTAIDACYSSYPFDCGRTSHWEQVEYFNTPRKFAADWEHETVLVDRDGTLSGMGAPGYSIVPKSSLYPQSMCVDAPDFSVEFPCQICNSIEFSRYGINQILPDSLRGFNMDVKNKWGSSVVPFRNKRSTHARGWMGILLSGEEHEMTWQNHEHITNISYRGTVYDFGKSQHVVIKHPFYQEVDDAEISGRKITTDSADIGLVADTSESFSGEEKSVLTTSDDPLSYHIDPQTYDFTIMFAKEDAIHSFYDVDYNFQVFKCFWPGCTPPTTPPPTTPPTNLNVCMWTDPTCWENNQVPLPGANVTIPIDKDVTLEMSVTIDILFIEGTLRIGNDTDITITVRDILINTGAGGHEDLWDRASINVENGNLYAGSEGNPWSCSNTLTINMVGDRFQEEFGAPAGTVPLGAKTIGVMGGLSLFGCPQPISWSLLSNTVQPGATSLTLEVDVSTAWKVGDEIVIAPTSYDAREEEKVTIQSIDGSVVTFTPALSFIHTGVIETMDNGLHMAAEVIHLSRNIKINGLTDSENMFGGRVVVVRSDDGSTYRHGWAQIDNVEFSQMGQFGHTRADDLRTPIAFYHIGNQAPGSQKRSYITNCAIHDTYNGAVTIGEYTDELTVSGNVIYKTVADAINVHGDNAIVTDNVIVFIQNRFLYQNMWLQQQLGNAEAEQMNLPAGINSIAIKFTGTYTGNRIAGGDGPAFKGHGTSCESGDLCGSDQRTVNKARVLTIKILLIQ